MSKEEAENFGDLLQVAGLSDSSEAALSVFSSGS
jgi:hypothetical protein